MGRSATTNSLSLEAGSFEMHWGGRPRRWPTGRRRSAPTRPRCPRSPSRP